MNKQYAFTYIIGYRHSPDRMQNLRRVLDWVNGFSNAEVILVEQDKHSKISNLNLKAKHIFLKSSLPYNKSWGFNVAVKNSNSNTIIFADSDLIMDPNKFIDAIKLLEQYDMVNPYNSVVDLDINESNMRFDQMFLIDRPGRGELDHQKVPLCGGICMFRKDAIMKIGGFSELFYGWGAEDDFVSLKVKTFLNWTEIPNKCYHLYHSRTQPDMVLYKRNLDLLNKFAQMPKEELMRQINASLVKIGMKNKHADNL
jgi:hypothetical protein